MYDSRSAGSPARRSWLLPAAASFGLLLAALVAMSREAGDRGGSAYREPPGEAAFEARVQELSTPGVESRSPLAGRVESAELPAGPEPVEAASVEEEPPGRDLTVRVVAPSGWSLDGVTVLLLDGDGFSAPAVEHRAPVVNGVADFTGRGLSSGCQLVLDGLPEGLLPPIRQVMRPAPVDRGVEVYLRTGRNEHTIELAGPAVVHGSVTVAGSGERVDHGVVRFTRRSWASDGEWPSRSSFWPGPAGGLVLGAREFPIEGGYYEAELHPGNWLVEVLLEHTDPETGHPRLDGALAARVDAPAARFVQLDPGPRQLDLAFTRGEGGGSVVGGVVDEDGRPFAGARYVIERESLVPSEGGKAGMRHSTRLRVGQSGPDGRFEARGLPPGEYVFCMMSFDALTDPPRPGRIAGGHAHEEFELEDGGEFEIEVQIERFRPVRLTGRVVLDPEWEDRGVDSIRMRVGWQTTLESGSVASRSEGVELAKDGSFDLHWDARKDARIRLWAPGGSALRVLSPVEAWDGVPITIEFPER
jgi:hypothetical protein